MIPPSVTGTVGAKNDNERPRIETVVRGSRGAGSTCPVNLFRAIYKQYPSFTTVSSGSIRLRFHLASSSVQLTLAMVEQ